MSKLKEFLQELGTNSKLLDVYKAAPAETMNYYGLKKKEVKAIMEADTGKLNEILGDDCERYLVIYNVNEHGY